MLGFKDILPVEFITAETFMEVQSSAIELNIVRSKASEYIYGKLNELKTLKEQGKPVKKIVEEVRNYMEEYEVTLLDIQKRFIRNLQKINTDFAVEPVQTLLSSIKNELKELAETLDSFSRFQGWEDKRK